MPIEQCIIYILHNSVLNQHILSVIINFHFYDGEEQKFENENEMWFSIIFNHAP
jgi:hypothetical protein